MAISLQNRCEPVPPLPESGCRSAEGEWEPNEERVNHTPSAFGHSLLQSGRVPPMPETNGASRTQRLSMFKLC